MLDQMFDTVRKATDATLQMQKEMFTRWTSFWPTFTPNSNNWAEEAQKYQKKWTDAVTDLTRKQRESLEEQFKIGMQNIEGTFQLGQAKDIEELRRKSIELWQTSFENLRRIYETQVSDFQSVMTTWTQAVSRVN